MPNPNIQLVIIDPQNDFCDIPGRSSALAVPGAHADMLHLAEFIRLHRDEITQIHITMDTHSAWDISHPAWWVNADGTSLPAFSRVVEDDLITGRIRAADPAEQVYSLAYLRALRVTNKRDHIVWPEHCLAGSWGHSVHDSVQDATVAWSRQQRKAVNMVWKGLNPRTEHYSALKAEVPLVDAPETKLNSTFVRKLSTADAVWVAGEALSHCVAETVRDMVHYVDPGRVALLTDCMTAVPGFEERAWEFLEEMAALGVRCCSSAALTSAPPEYASGG